MAGFGFHEAINYSFIGKSAVERLGLLPEDPRRNTIDILNPLSEDQAVMRTTLLPGLLETIQKNVFRQEKNLKLFELGRAFYYTGEEQLPHEVEMLAGLWTGLRNSLSWHTKSEPCDFFDMKGVVESLLCTLGICNVSYTRMPAPACSYTQPGRTAQIRYGDTYIGLIGEIQPTVLKAFDVKQAAFAFEIHVDAMIPLLPAAITFSPIPRFPAVNRDITLIVDNSRVAGDMLSYVRGTETDLVEDAFIFDVYSGEPIPADKKSVSIRIIYRSFTQTLEDEQVNALHQTITDSLLTAFGATLPA
jgi:phenylalanyl-tRNA synthetase beta chain